MELLALPSLLYFLTCLLLLLLSIRFLQKQSTHSKSNLPPGPRTLPLIGSLHHLTGSLPHRVLRDLAQLHGPVMFLRAGETDLFVFSSREAAKEVMQTHDANFVNRPVLRAPNVLFYGCMDIGFSNGPYWRQLRKISATMLFSAKQVKYYSSNWQEEINSMLKRLSLVSGKSQVNLSTWTTELSNNIIIRAAFGGKFKMKEVLMELLAEEIVQEHLKNKQQQKKRGEEEIVYDFVDALIDIKERGDLELPITMDSIKAIILDVFLGGTETSGATVTWAMAELIKHPVVLAKAQTEIRQAANENPNFDKNTLSYLQLVIKETLRMHTPAVLLPPRECKETCHVLGYTIPSGARLIVNAWAIGRNPDYWNDPDEFKPERFETSDIDLKGQNFDYLPFGAGRRICPGLKFGSTVVEDVLASLLLHFDWKLPDGMKPEDIDMTERFSLSCSKKESLYLVPTLRVPLPDV